MLETRPLRYFLAIADHLHFGRAAESLNVAQSALSAQLRGLEEHLGVRLVNRSKRAAVSLTEAGLLFLVEARQSLQQIERTEHVGKLAARGQLGRVDIGYVVSAAVSGLLPRCLRLFRQKNPLVVISLMPLDTGNQLKSLVDGTIDLAFIRPRPSYPDGIAIHEVHDEPLNLAVSEVSELASASAIPCSSLENESFIVPHFNETASFSDQLVQLGNQAGFEIIPAYEVPDFISALTLVSSGYGVTLIPASFERLRFPGVVIREISGFDSKATIALASRSRNENRAATSLIGQIVSECRHRSP